jgi:hypothetical protein
MEYSPYNLGRCRRGCWNDEYRTGLNIESRLAHTSDFIILHTANPSLTSQCLRRPLQPCPLPPTMPLFPRSKLLLRFVPLPSFFLLFIYLCRTQPQTPPNTTELPLFERLNLNSQQCASIFPLQYTLLDKLVARGPFPFKPSPPDYQGLVQGRILNNTVCVPPYSIGDAPLTNWYHSYTSYPSRLIQPGRLYSNAPQH